MLKYSSQLTLIDYFIISSDSHSLLNTSMNIEKLLLVFGLSFTLMTGTSLALEKVTLQLKWHHQFQFAGYYAAFEKGYYKDVGLNVSIKPGGPTVKVDQEVLSGRADYGVLASELIGKRVQGKKAVLLAVVFQHSIRALISRADSEIYSPSDLIGQTIMLNGNEQEEFLAMLKAEGISSNDINIISKDNTANQKLINKEVVAINGSIANQPFIFAQKDVEVKLLRPIMYGIDFYGDSFFTSEKEVEQHPKRATAFRDASLKGWEYAMRHPEEIIQLIHNKYNPSKTIAHLRFEAQALRKIILPDLVDLGHINHHRIEKTAEIYARYSVIEKDYSLAGFIYNPVQDEIESAERLRRRMLISAIIFIFLAIGVLIWIVVLRKTVAKRTYSLSEEIKERKKIEKGLLKSEERFRNLFENSPVCLWEEDFSDVKKYLQSLKNSVTSAFEQYLDDHPEVLHRCVDLVKILDVNKATMELLGAKTKKELQDNLANSFNPDSLQSFKKEIIAIWEGEHFVETEAVSQTLDGIPKYVSLSWRVSPGFEDSLAKVLVSLTDITERIESEMKLEWELKVNKTLVELAELLIEGKSSLETISNLILEAAKSYTESEHGFVSVIDPKTGDNIGYTLTNMMDSCKIEEKGKKIAFPIGPDGKYPLLWGEALNTHKPFYTNIPDTHPASGGLPKGHIPLKNFLAVPAMISDSPMGEIALANKPGEYSDVDLEVITQIAQMFAIAIDRQQAIDNIEDSLKEKEILLQEIHHRVKNNMQIISSLLKLQANNIKDSQIKEVLKESQSRVYTMSAVHEALHESDKLSEIDIKN